MGEEVNDSHNWGHTDPCPGIPLASISRISTRASALVVRAKDHPLLRGAFLQTAGAAVILKGLDYHHDRFMGAIRELSSCGSDSALEESLRHEAVAYVNRLGQFSYFSRSSLVVDRVGRPSTPKLDDLVLFRDKHTAHRSVDDPRKADSEQLQTVHSMALTEFGGRHFSQKPGLLWPPSSDPTSRWRNGFLGYQIHTADKLVNLVIERDHDDVMLECYAVIEALLS